ALEPKLAELGGQGAPDAAAGAKTWAEQKRRIDALKLSISELKLALAGETDIPARINAQLQEKQTALAEAETWLQIHQADASLLTEFPEIAQLRNVRSELAELSGEYKKQSGWSKKITAAVSKNQARIVNAEARQQELAILIENNQKTLAELTHGKSLEELKELQDEQQTRADQFQALFETAAVHARFAEKKGLFDWFKRAQPLALPDVVALQIHLDDLKQDFASAENISMALDKAISNETLLKKLNIQRNKLIEGKPCLLCGSTHHPYTFKPPLLSDSRKALADQRNKVMVLKTMIESAEKQVANAQKQLNNADAKQKFLAEKRSEWRLLANKLNLMHENLQIEHLATQKQLLADETGELGRIKSLVNERSQLEREIVNAKDEIAAKKALAASLRLGAEQLNERHAGNTPEMDEVQAKYLQLQSNEADLSKRIEAQLKLLGEKMPSAGKENAVFDRLNGRRQDYQINEIRRNGLLEEVNDLQQKLQTCQAAILNYQQQINANLEELREEEQIGLHLSAFDKQQTVTGLEKQINDRHIALQSMQRGFAEKISAAGFDTLDELKETLQLAENQPEIAAQLADCRTQAEQIHFQRLQIDLRLQREMQDYDDSISEEDIARMQALLAEKLQIAEQEVRSLQFKLDKQQKYRAKYQSLDGELTQLRMQLAAGEEEIRQLQSEPGGMQRRNRQLLIDKLLTKANQILEKISGRYYLRSAGSEHGLALEIEDVKQKNVRRLPKTLSGGESFVVSLALALALADIANNGKTIESLFLDEGFGNLDAEALYLAMSTLERLRLQGKTVGVISHVEAVKKRIKTQITLVKNANGLSELKLVA
ncbi:MAG: SbcC/MukB-like Walker B domain-containing protein, partial [Methylomonas sp.]